MEKYNKNLGYYYLRQRFENYYFNPPMLKQMDKEFFDVSIIKETENEKNELEEDLGLKKIYLSVAHPGLLIGTGTKMVFTEEKTKEANNKKYNNRNKEEEKEDNYKLGINFDYTSGLPYISGSSIKGVLRSFFPNVNEKIEENREISRVKAGIINLFLDKNYSLDELEMITGAIFEGFKGYNEKGEKEFLPIYQRDKFIEGRIIVDSKSNILERDYLTSHKKILKDPNPLELIKIPPQSKIEIFLQLHDTNVEGISITADEKLDLFKNILYLSGLGAKTNTGYGHFNEEESRILTQERETILRKKQEELVKLEREKERKKLEEERAKLSPIERWKLEFEEKSADEKKNSYKKDLDSFENINDKKIIAQAYLDFYGSEEKPSKKTKEKIKELNNILKS